MAPANVAAKSKASALYVYKKTTLRLQQRAVGRMFVT
jgi:hypothetical protein